MKCIYLIGSLRNPKIPEIGNSLVKRGFLVFDDWFAAGPIADDSWQEYEKNRGTPYDVALRNYAAEHVFKFDEHHLNRADMGVLVMPAGKSGHIELGYMIGKGKPCYVLFDSEPERWDVMYRFANGVFFNLNSLEEHLASVYCRADARHRQFQLSGV